MNKSNVELQNSDKIQSEGALVLDFGGVICLTIFETHRESEKILGLQPGTLNWMGPFAPTTDTLWQSMQKDEISERQYYEIRAQEVSHLVGAKWDEVADFLRAVYDDEKGPHIREEALQAIAGVKNAGLKVALLSNELDLFMGPGIRNHLPILKEFDAIVDATYTNILKPDPRAYQMIIDAISIPAHSCVFVDDQMRNVNGAIKSGMRAVHFDVQNPSKSFAQSLEMLGITVSITPEP